ncbi:MAG: Tex-like N-terminal domain-containing protein, partial [bacterium]
MKEQDMIRLLAAELKVKDWQIEKTIELFDAGNTIPFVARYRKEVTGELDEEQLRLLAERLQYLRNLAKRKEEISNIIEEQGKMTEELAGLIAKAVKLQELEDIYLPYKPKKRTRAQIAKEKGLEPLAELVLRQE